MKRSLLFIAIFCSLLTLRSLAQPMIMPSTTPLSFSSIYGTPSSTQTFVISGANMQAGILVTPPAGFEVSLNNFNFTPTITVGSAGNIPFTTVYIRLAGTTNAGSYTGDINLSSQGALSVNRPTMTGKIDPLRLNLTIRLTKTYGQNYPSGTYNYTQMDDKWDQMLKNGNKVNTIDVTFLAGADAFARAGTYPGAVTIKNFTGRDGYLPGNYILTYQADDVYVNEADLTITANDVTKPFGTTLANVANSNAFTTSGLRNGESITTVDINYGTGAAATAAIGTYPTSVVPVNARGGTIDPNNYNIIYKPGKLNVVASDPEITPNAPFAYYSIMACVGTASVDPYLQQFAVSSKNLKTDITATAPTHFEIALSPGGPFRTALTIPAPSGTVNNVTVYVRSAATAPAGTIKGDINLVSAGAPTKTVGVSGTINALPTLTKPADVTYTNGDNTAILKLSGTGNHYIWTNDNPAIGLPASGLGDIASFKALNTTTSPIKATITATPASLQYISVVTYNNTSVGTISNINSATNQVTDVQQISSYARSISYSKDGNELFIAHDQHGIYTTLNAGTNAFYEIVGIGGLMIDILSAKNNTTMYAIMDNWKGAFTFTRANSGNRTEIPLGGEATAMAMSADEKRLYITTTLPNAVVVIDPATDRVINTITQGITTKPNRIITSPDGSKLYITGTGITVINTANNAVIANYAVSVNTFAAVISPDGNRLYVTDPSGNRVLVLNAATGAQISTITVGKKPQALAITPDGTRVYVANYDGGTVSLINALNNAVTNTINVDPEPIAIGISNGTGCPGIPEKFTITVNPSPKFTATGAPSAVDTEYGTNSLPSTFIISGKSRGQTVSVKAPPGFSVSVNGLPYAGELIFSDAWLANPLKISIILNANTDAGPHSGDITISSPGVATLLVPMPKSTVRPAPITLRTDQVVKTYGQALTTPATSTAGLVPTLGSLKNGNTITSLTLRYRAGYSAADNVNLYTNAVEIFAVNGSNGFSENNYIITKQTANLRVDRAALNIKANDISKVYGTTLTAGNVTSGFIVTGLQNQQAVNGVTFTYNGGTAAADGVKTYTASITPSVATGTFIASNYAISYTEGNVIVTPATITVTVNNATRDIGKDNPLFSANYTGFVNTDDIKVIRTMAQLSTVATKSSPAKTYAINATGAAADNYIFTYVPGVLTVTTPPLIPLIIPNTITPNGDGINDSWTIGNAFAYPKLTVNIYTRYGQPVFTSVGYAVPWDGKYNGQYLNAGTYYYVIRKDLSDKPMSGSITLLR